MGRRGIKYVEEYFERKNNLGNLKRFHGKY